MGVVAILFGGPAALAQEPEIVLGVSAGDTLGVTWKFVDPERVRNAYEASVGWTIRGEDACEFRWMYQRIVRQLRGKGRELVQIYAGAGFRVKLEDARRYGLRGAVGASFLLARENLSPEFYVEAAPLFDVTPRHRSGVGAAAGVRWRL